MPEKREFPQIYEKSIPIVLTALAIIASIMLLVSVLVILGLFR